MAALTHQKSDLRRQVVNEVYAYYDALDAVDKRILVGGLASSLAGKLTVDDLRDWLGKLQRKNKEIASLVASD